MHHPGVRLVLVVVALGAIALSPAVARAAMHNWGYMQLLRAIGGREDPEQTCEALTGSCGRAARAFALALKLDPTDWGAKRGLGTIDLMGRRDAYAIDLFFDVLRSEPDDSQTRLLIGLLLLRRGRGAEAVEQWAAGDMVAPAIFWLHEASRETPHEADAPKAPSSIVLDAAFRRVDDQESSDIADTLYGIFRQRPGLGSQAYYVLARWLQDIRRDRAAAELYDIALREDTFRWEADFRWAMYGKAFNLSRTTDWQAAKVALEQTLAEYPDFPDLMTSLGDIYRDQEANPEAARDWYLRAIQLPEAGANPYLHLGEIPLRQGNAREALEWFELGLAADPDSGWVYLQLGRAHLATREYALAADEGEVATARMPGVPETWLLLGQARRGIGQLAQAEAALREAVRLNPNDQRFRTELAEVTGSNRNVLTPAGVPAASSPTPGASR